ncbi:MAG: 50S ribosomal protein L10 [Candidatus Aenigmatarchaeota archaeon]
MVKEWKKEEVEELTEKLEETPVVGIINMHKLPAPQLQDMRKELYGKADIRMSKKTLMHFALEDAEKEGIGDLEEKLIGESAFVFTEMNPFQLYKYLQENKSSAPAKAGDVAPNKIVVNEGSTGLDPGPAIGKLQNAGIPTTIEEGKIHVKKDTVVAEQGDEIDEELAAALKMLEMEPMEIGLNLQAVWEGGVIFDPEDLKIDAEEYKDKIIAGYRNSVNLAINSGYPTKETIEFNLQKAWSEARNLAVNSDYTTEEVIEDIIKKAYNEAKSLKTKTQEVS